MAIIVSDSGGGNFTPHPEGQYAARCVDVVDMGWQRTDYGPKYKVRVVFFCGEFLDKEVDGKTVNMPMLVSSFFTASLHEKSNLRQFLESWRGAVFTADELGRFDLEKMLDAPAFLQIIHRKVGEKTYANIKSIMRIPQNMTPPDTPADFERACDREGWTGPAPHPDHDRSAADPGDSVPEDTTDYSADDDLPF